jgi:cytidine deaminase
VTGENSSREVRDGCNYGTHAEMDAIKKLKKVGKKKGTKLNLIVIRIDKEGNLKNSLPCFKCLQYLSNVSYGYHIKSIYYSNDDGNIEMVKLSKLLNSDKKHVSRRFRY